MFLKSPSSLILASTSIYRRELLARVQIPFECRSPGTDEAPRPGEDAVTLVARLAQAKARAIAVQQPDSWVIGSDQVAILLDGAQRQSILGKPGSVANCIEQLLKCSGRTLSFVTAVAVVRHSDSSLFEFTDTTRVAFRRLDAAVVERYVARELPLDCAGGFKSEGLGITLCESIDSADPTALIGLPLIRLCAVLRTVGFELP
ncbi:MAG: Maf family nucleotide pyrophosphatase [Pseudomonadota bacterium]|nr:Maf family nucleotide pyrophosphatase [Pseudomonadota bacterium]